MHHVVRHARIVTRRWIHLENRKPGPLRLHCIPELTRAAKYECHSLVDHTESCLKYFLINHNMEITEKVTNTDHEQVLIARDTASGYHGIIAIHSTALGPAVGGTRFWKYASEDEALTDVLRLSQGMTYKTALAGLPLGGGKSIIIGDNKTPNREALLRAHGRFVDTLKGRYITAEDVGTSPGDMEIMRLETQYVAGLVDGSGDPS